ncbi:MAG: hypothetical protein DWQ02_12635 [Bacteroidetes bacterium]|nr:MAG: hypothetical protein DWQ02_12635 [Bacteroidota bacterium]
MVRLKGSTIIEAMIAMTVITIVFLVGMMAIGRLGSSYKTVESYKVDLEMENQSQKTRQTQRYFDETIVFSGFMIEKKVDESEYGKNVLLLSLKAFDTQDRLLNERKELIYVGR